MKVFQREDGLWHRAYDWTKNKRVETIKMTRGLGWTMEGLLAMNRMYPDTIYLDYAVKTSRELTKETESQWFLVFYF